MVSCMCIYIYIQTICYNYNAIYIIKWIIYACYSVMSCVYMYIYIYTIHTCCVCVWHDVAYLDESRGRCLFNMFMYKYIIQRKSVDFLSGTSTLVLVDLFLHMAQDCTNWPTKPFVYHFWTISTHAISAANDPTYPQVWSSFQSFANPM